MLMDLIIVDSFMFFLKLHDSLTFLLHFEPLNGLSSVWILSWLFQALLSESLHNFNSWKVFHRYEFFHVSSNAVIVVWLNFFAHFEQLNGFLPVSILSLVYELCSHWEQLYGFLSVWNLSWVFKIPDELNFFSHFAEWFFIRDEEPYIEPTQHNTTIDVV